MLLARLNPRGALFVRLAGLVLICWSVFHSDHRPGGHGRGLVVSLLLAACVIAWLWWTARPAGERITPDLGVVALAVANVIYDDLGVGLVAYALGFAASALAASNSRQSVARAEQAELLLAQTQRSQEERLRAARLEESTRIARDIHDVLAHALAEEGLRETRLAVGALRGDAVAAPAAVEALVAEYRAESGAPVELTIDGDRSRLAGPTGQAVLRVVQEALTNVRKHAPGAAVTVTVDAGAQPGDEVVAVVDDRPTVPSVARGRPEPSSLAATGGGYGVEGMRERARGLGGTLSAGIDGQGWRVELRLPAPVAEGGA